MYLYIIWAITICCTLRPLQWNVISIEFPGTVKYKDTQSVLVCHFLNQVSLKYKLKVTVKKGVWEEQ
jgi:hypothetical protein